MEINIKDINKAGKEKKEKSTRKENIFTRDISFGQKMSDKKKFWFYNELSLLLSSGVDIKTAFELIASEERGKKLEMLTKLKNDIINGYSLSESIERQKSFSTYDRYTIKIGEESGKLSHVLNLLAIYYEKRIKLRRQIVSALTYPSLVILAAFGAISFLINFLVPMFEDVFTRFSGNLPAITQSVIDFANWMSDNGLIVILVLIGLVVTLRMIKNYTLVRSIGSFLQLKIPVMGIITHKNTLARFCQAMALLLSSRVPLSNALELVKNMIHFYPLEKALPKIQASIEQGEHLHKSMQNFSFFDSRMVYLVKVAEEINQLDQIFDRLQQQYFEDVEHRIKILNNLLEPLLIIVVGLIVGFILVAMYLPLFQLGGGFI